MPTEVDEAINEAITSAKLPLGTPAQRIKQLLLNKLTDQYRQDDLVSLLNEMPVPNENDEA